MADKCAHPPARRKQLDLLTRRCAKCGLVYAYIQNKTNHRLRRVWVKMSDPRIVDTEQAVRLIMKDAQNFMREYTERLR